MGAYIIVKYAVSCDGEGCHKQTVDMLAFGCRDAVDQAIQKYKWIKVGRKVYCSTACASKKYEAAR